MHWKTEYIIISIAGFLDTVNWYNAVNPATINSILELKKPFSIFIVTQKVWRLVKPFIAQIAYRGQCNYTEIIISQVDLVTEFLMCTKEKLDELQPKKNIILYLPITREGVKL